MKPNCYECKYRSSLPGDCHSAFTHPNVFTLMVSAISGLCLSPVVGNQHGIDNGWFYWPVNFDPIWLESCALFEPTQKENERLCVCGHSADYHDHDAECYYNDQPSGATGCLCGRFKEKK
jgi:hypothetical protein